MNGPSDHPSTVTGVPERVTRLEVTCERIFDELRELRIDMRELRGEFREMRRTSIADFRILFGAIIAVALGLAGVMANGFGWL